MATAKAKATTAFAAMLVIVGGGAVIAAHGTVSEGHVGVYKHWGGVTGATTGPGAYWINPVSQSVQQVEIRPRQYTMTSTEGEGDRSRADSIPVQSVNGTTFSVDVTIRYRVDADEAENFSREWNSVKQFEDRLIRPIVRSTIRDSGSDIQSSVIFTADGRRVMENASFTALDKEMDDEPVILEGVDIRDVDPPRSYQQALDEKEVAKQRVERERQRVRQQELIKEQKIISAEANATSRLIRANATARSNKKISASIDERLIRYRYVDSLDRSDTIYMPIGDDGLPVFVGMNRSVNGG